MTTATPSLPPTIALPSMPAMPALPAMPAFARPRLSRRWALGAIVAAHALLLVALEQGMLRAPAPVQPQEVMLTIITPPPSRPLPRLPASEPPRVKPTLTVPPPQIALPAVQDSVTAVVAETPPAPVVARVEPRVEPVAPPAPPAASGPRSVTSGIEYVRAPQPVYPAMSRRLGEQGTVMLRVLVNDQGRPERVEIAQSSGSQRLDDAARQAVMRALFKPYSEGGVTLAMYATVPIKFETTS